MSVLHGTFLELLFNRMLLEKGLSVTMSSEVYVSPCCINCGRVVGELDEDEKKAFLSNGFDGLLCFDCEPIVPDCVPEFFNDILDGEVLFIDTVSLELRENEFGQGNFVQSRAHERAPLRNLSSYTKLNRNTKKTGLIVGGVESFLCAMCSGTGIVSEFVSSYKCPWCDGEGNREAFIYLPKWIISGGTDV